MKISAINLMPRTHFNGENSKKSNGLKNVAGATMIALATAVPSQEVDAQHYHHHHHVPVYPHVHYVVPAPVMNIPKCFVYGDVTNEDYEKTLPDVFNEIDREIQENGQISVNEVVRLEEHNWNSTNAYPMTRGQKTRTANLVKNLSKQYNDKGSNPNTINYNEYKKIMNSYMQSQNAANLINLLQILGAPYHNHHHHHHTPPHRHHH